MSFQKYTTTTLTLLTAEVEALGSEVADLRAQLEHLKAAATTDDVTDANLRMRSGKPPSGERLKLPLNRPPDAPPSPSEDTARNVPGINYGPFPGNPRLLYPGYYGDQRHGAGAGAEAGAGTRPGAGGGGHLTAFDYLPSSVPYSAAGTSGAPGGRRRGWFPHLYIFRGADKTQPIGFGEASMSEYHWALLQMYADPACPSQHRSPLLAHACDVMADSIDFRWLDVRRWSEGVLADLYSEFGASPAGWADQADIQRRRKAVSRAVRLPERKECALFERRDAEEGWKAPGQVGGAGSINGHYSDSDDSDSGQIYMM